MNIQLKDIFIDENPGSYIPSAGLVKALEVAYALKRPLLISGEPGTGKTNFAKWVADKLSNQGFWGEPFIYNTKSSSTSQDLFYYYDAVMHFRDNQVAIQRHVSSFENVPRLQEGDKKDLIELNKEISRTTIDFIELKAMGLAFAHAIGLDESGEHQALFERSNVKQAGKGAVVLIDEIDKASRDFPNDILNEIERYTFEIHEINKQIALNNEQRKKIIIILTSNLEKSMPEAFLRRCVYYHIDFPTKEMLLDITKKRLNLSDENCEAVLVKIDEFFLIRNSDGVSKKPSTSEFIDWIRILKEDGVLTQRLYDKNDQIINKSVILNYLYIVLKKQEDILLFEEQ